MKLLAPILGALLVGSNGWWLYHAIDQGVTDMYREQTMYEAANRVTALSVIATETVRGKTKTEASALLQRLFPGKAPFEKDGALHTTWITLTLSKEGIVSGIALDTTIESFSQKTSVK